MQLTFFSDYVDRNISTLKFNLLQHVFNVRSALLPSTLELVLIKKKCFGI